MSLSDGPLLITAGWSASPLDVFVHELRSLLEVRLGECFSGLGIMPLQRVHDRVVIGQTAGDLLGDRLEEVVRKQARGLGDQDGETGRPAGSIDTTVEVIVCGAR